MNERNTSRIKTEFAPAERATLEEIKEDARLLNNSESLQYLTNTVPCIVMSLNKERQIVFKNKVLMDLLEAESDEMILGKRPGELFECIHSDENPGGCGTTRFCSECGALEAIMESWSEGKCSVKECRIITNNGQAYEFKVTSNKYCYADKEFLIFSLTDISNEKRKDVLEKTFIHDINNVLGVIHLYSNLLDGEENQEKKDRYIDKILTASRQLTKEISSHSKLIRAERKELALSIKEVSTLKLLNELQKSFYDNAVWQDRQLILDNSALDLQIYTDSSLLYRVLENMVVNALEATTQSQSVVVSCRQEGDKVRFSVSNPGYMPESVQLQLFQRSFSTKGVGRGIGTYSMKLFGEEYLKGHLDFSTDKEEGTSFFLTLPHQHPDYSPDPSSV